MNWSESRVMSSILKEKLKNYFPEKLIFFLKVPRYTGTVVPWYWCGGKSCPDHGKHKAPLVVQWSSPLLPVQRIP